MQSCRFLSLYTYLFVKLLIILLKSCDSALLHCFLSKTCPENHIDGEDGLPLPIHDPIVSRFGFGVVLEGFFNDVLD